eukprot:6198693-Pleurochrysis_carterae.AAC.1
MTDLYCSQTGVASFTSTTNDLWPASTLLRAGCQQDTDFLVLEKVDADIPTTVCRPGVKPCFPLERTHSASNVLGAASDSELGTMQPHKLFSSLKDAAAHRASLRDRLERLDAKTRVAKQELNTTAERTTMDLIRERSFVNPTSTMSQASTSVPPLVAPTAPPPAPAPAS